MSSSMRHTRQCDHLSQMSSDIASALLHRLNGDAVLAPPFDAAIDDWHTRSCAAQKRAVAKPPLAMQERR